MEPSGSAATTFAGSTDALGKALLGAPVMRPWPPTLAEARTILTGQPYEVIGRVGHGGMGAVFKVRNLEPGMERLEAVKIRRPEARDDDLFRARFLREIGTLAQLRHPGITTVFRSGDSAEGYLWFSMEFLDGRSLAELLAPGLPPLTPERVLDITRQLCITLQFIHTAGRLHRDLKPANVMVCEDGSVRLLDFGIARPVEASPMGALTHPGNTPHTPDYAAPEQKVGGPVDERTDLYGLGRIVTDMIRPAAGAARERQTRFAQRLLDLVADLLAYDRQDRPGSAAEVIEKLGQIEPDSPGFWGKDRCPFRGLEAYQPEHAEIFFGRDAAIRRGQEILQQSPEASWNGFLLITGASGSGKSSLARAGLGPTLVRGSIPTAAGHVKIAPILCDLSTIRLDNDCLLAPLARLLAAAVPHTNPAAIADALRDPAADPGRTLGMPPDPARAIAIALVLDQFEHFFRTDLPRSSQTRFLTAIARLARTPGIAVLATLRSDFYHQCAEHPALMELKDGRQLDVAAPQPWELAAMLRLSARAGGLTFETGPDGRSLDDVLLEHARRNPQVLPLLSYVLNQLWERRDLATNTLCFADYEALGGFEGAVGIKASETLDRFAEDFPNDTAAALDDLLHLVIEASESSDGDAFVRRRASADELNTATPSVRHLAERLVTARLLVQDSTGLTLAHDALLSPAVVNRWKSLRRWLANNARDLRVRKRVAMRCRDWLSHRLPADLLLSAGSLLAEAVALLQERPALFSVGQREFIQRSNTVAAEAKARHKAQANPRPAGPSGSPPLSARHERPASGSKRKVLAIAAVLVALSTTIAGFVMYSGNTTKDAEQRRKAAEENNPKTQRQSPEQIGQAAEAKLIADKERIAKEQQDKEEQNKRNLAEANRLKEEDAKRLLAAEQAKYLPVRIAFAPGDAATPANGPRCSGFSVEGLDGKGPQIERQQANAEYKTAKAERGSRLKVTLLGDLYGTKGQALASATLVLPASAETKSITILFPPALADIQVVNKYDNADYTQVKITGPQVSSQPPIPLSSSAARVITAAELTPDPALLNPPPQPFPTNHTPLHIPVAGHGPWNLTYTGCRLGDKTLPPIPDIGNAAPPPLETPPPLSGTYSLIAPMTRFPDKDNPKLEATTEEPVKVGDNYEVNYFNRMVYLLPEDDKSAKEHRVTFKKFLPDTGLPHFLCLVMELDLKNSERTSDGKMTVLLTYPHVGFIQYHGDLSVTKNSDRIIKLKLTGRKGFVGGREHEGIAAWAAEYTNLIAAKEPDPLKQLMDGSLKAWVAYQTTAEQKKSLLDFTTWDYSPDENTLLFDLESGKDTLCLKKAAQIYPKKLLDAGYDKKASSPYAIGSVLLKEPVPMTRTGAARPPDPELFTFIPAGEFTMGDTLDGGHEAAPHKVNISAFYLAKHEVTKALWDEVRTWGPPHGYTDLEEGAGKAGNHPVASITWYAMVKWCNARSEMDGLTPCYRVAGEVYRTGSTPPVCNWSANGYRLPTEAEWEKAARGGLGGNRFPCGNAIHHNTANFRNDGKESYQSGTTGDHPSYKKGSQPNTSPVGSFAANGYGLYDMAGNVVEWCWDWSHAVDLSTPQTDPRGPDKNWARVLRGGSWSSYAGNCRVAYRDDCVPSDGMHSNVGFRVARSSVP